MNSEEAPGVSQSATRLLAFYLPQFHPIPENDLWWGKGFTEWTNVVQAKPLFPGHYQPHLPADLGFYDLRLPETREAQADLAREYGIHGFCYHHYWFKGRRILDRPLDEVLASGRPDFPFCLCWANHNWTRRWDGRDQERLIVQEYSEEDDRQHIRWLLGVFQDERYIRVDGRPLLLIWRTYELPDALRTVTLWKEEARRMGMTEPYICNVETNGEDGEPHQYGCDAAVEFPPQRVNPPIERVYGPGNAYRDNSVREYRDLVARSLEREDPPYRRFPGVIPSWDKTPRFKNGGAGIFQGSTPELYEYWLKGAIERTSSAPPEEQLVFINAWNEWAEGTHLEPDLKYGHAYLEATRQALRAAGADVPATVASDGRNSEGPGEASAPLPIEERYRYLLDKYTQLQQYIARQLSDEEDSAVPPALRAHYEDVEQRYKKLKARHRNLVERHKALKGRTDKLKAGRLEKNSAKDADRLVRWLHQLDADISALLGSRRWKAVHALGEIQRWILLKPRKPAAVDSIARVLGEFRSWRRQKSSKTKDRAGGEG